MDAHAFENGTTTVAMKVPNDHHSNCNGLPVSDHSNSKMDHVVTEAMNGSVSMKTTSVVNTSNGTLSINDNDNHQMNDMNSTTNGVVVDHNFNTVGTTAPQPKTSHTSTPTRSTIETNGSSTITGNTCHINGSKDIHDTSQILPPLPSASMSPPPILRPPVPTTSTSPPSTGGLTIASDRVTYTEDTIIANYTYVPLFGIDVCSIYILLYRSSRSLSSSLILSERSDSRSTNVVVFFFFP